MDAIEIIEKFGGRTAVVELTGAAPNAVTQWRKAGIPAHYWHLFIGKHGVTADALLGTRPSRAPQPAQAA